MVSPLQDLLHCYQIQHTIKKAGKNSEGNDKYIWTECQCSYTISSIPAYGARKVFSVPGVIYEDVSEGTQTVPFWGGRNWLLEDYSKLIK